MAQGQSSSVADAPDTLPSDFFSKKKPAGDAPDTLPADFFAKKDAPAPRTDVLQIPDANAQARAAIRRPIDNASRNSMDSMLADSPHSSGKSFSEGLHDIDTSLTKKRDAAEVANLRPGGSSHPGVYDAGARLARVGSGMTSGAAAGTAAGMLVAPELVGPALIAHGAGTAILHAKKALHGNPEDAEAAIGGVAEMAGGAAGTKAIETPTSTRLSNAAADILRKPATAEQSRLGEPGTVKNILPSRLQTWTLPEGLIPRGAKGTRTNPGPFSDIPTRMPPAKAVEAPPAELGSPENPGMHSKIPTTMPKPKPVEAPTDTPVDRLNPVGQHGPSADEFYENRGRDLMRRKDEKPAGRLQPAATTESAAPVPQATAPKFDVKKAVTDIANQAAGVKPREPLKPNVPLKDQAAAPAGEDPIKTKYPDPAVRQMVRANGEDVVAAVGNDKATMKAIHDLSNVDVRQAAINSGIDVGQKHVGSKTALGDAQISRQELLSQLIKKGHSPADIVRLAGERPESSTRLSQIGDRAEAPKPIAKNGSGESGASQEAINRVAANKSAGVKRFRVTGSGIEVPLHGVDAVDAHPTPVEHIIEKGPNGTHVVESGARARAYTPKDAQYSGPERRTGSAHDREIFHKMLTNPEGEQLGRSMRDARTGNTGAGSEGPARQAIMRGPEYAKFRTAELAGDTATMREMLIKAKQGLAAKK